MDGQEHGYSLVVPLQTADRTVAVLGIERPEAPFANDAIEIVERLARESALRLDAALLFSDVRTIATAEERRRVAREIHDGIAQELASIGYVVDDLAADVDDTRTRDALSGLRAELSRVIGELRMSIFDLRSEVATAGLGATLSDYARWVGATSDLTVHLTLDESPNRLPDRDRDRAVANRAGGHHQRPQARWGTQPLGSLQRCAAERGPRGGG